MKYNVKITETLERTVEVEANSKYKAEELVQQEYNKQKHILDAGDFTTVNFECEPRMIKVLIIEVGKEPRVAKISEGLKPMQEVVGGRIEAYELFKDQAAIICNEEGKLKGLPPNRVIRDENKAIKDVIVGTFFICGAPMESDQFVSLSDKQLEKFKEQFKYPERIKNTANGIIAMPFKAKDDKGMER
jgi:hypothetical protein